MLPATSPRITYCTGYWPVGGNAKRASAYYERYIPRTLRMIAGSRLILFYGDDTILTFFARHAREHRVELHGIKIPIQALPAYPQAERLLAGCIAMKDGLYLADARMGKKEKGVKHYPRDYLGSGPENYKAIISIWMSKIALMADHAVSANPFNTDCFAWIDASIARFKFSRSNWNFMRLSFAEDALYHYNNDTRCMGQRIAINASFLFAHKNVWREVGKLFQDQVAGALNEPYAHDEETILNRVVQSHPNLFRLAGRNHRGYRKALFKLWNRWGRLIGAR